MKIVLNSCFFFSMIYIWNASNGKINGEIKTDCELVFEVYYKNEIVAVLGEQQKDDKQLVIFMVYHIHQVILIENLYT